MQIIECIKDLWFDLTYRAPKPRRDLAKYYDKQLLDKIRNKQTFKALTEEKAVNLSSGPFVFKYNN